MLAQLNDCIGGLLHLGPNVITFRTLLHLGQLLHLGLQHPLLHFICTNKHTLHNYFASFGPIYFFFNFSTIYFLASGQAKVTENWLV